MAYVAPQRTVNPNLWLFYLLLKNQSKLARSKRENGNLTKRKLSLGIGIRFKSNGKEKIYSFSFER